MNLEDVLDDLFTRFVMNLPREEISSAARLGFQLEQAWWFYDDFYRLENPKLPKMSLKKFIQCLLARYPEWTQMNAIDTEVLIATFLKYKSQVPTCGAILLNEGLGKCLMVKGWASSTWTFPKGKIAKDEAPEQCAIREVQEEIGFDITGRFSPHDYIQMETGPHALRLYMVPGIRETTTFQTLTRKEISAIKWFNIADLGNPNTANKFYNVSSFLGRLKAYVKRQKKALDPSVDAESPVVPVVQEKKAQVAVKLAKKPAAYPPTQPQAKKTTPVATPPKKMILQRPQQPPKATSPVPFKFNLEHIENAFVAGWNKAIAL